MKKSHQQHLNLDEALKTLGNPIRLQLFIEILEAACECDLSKKDQLQGNCVTSLANKLGLPQSTVSTHVKELMQADLIVSEKVGRKLFLFGHPEMARRLKAFGAFVVDEVEGHPHV